MKEDVDGQTFQLLFFYDYLDVEERVETLVYDIGNFLAAVGGNLGLAVGFSCLSVLLIAVEFIQGKIKQNFTWFIAMIFKFYGWF